MAQDKKSGWGNDFRVFLAILVLITSLGGAVCAALDLLPPTLVKVGQSLGLALTLILAVVGGGLLAVVSISWKNSKHRQFDVVGASVLAIALLVGLAVYNAASSTHISKKAASVPTFVPTSSASATIAPISPPPQPTSTPPTSILGLTLLLEEQGPMCSAAWSSPSEAATPALDCAKAYTDMQQSSSSIYAERDLSNAPSGVYDQEPIEVHITETFLSSSDPSTYAAVLAETPTEANVCGGYAFALNALGSSELQTFGSCTTFPQVTQGAAIALTPGQPANVVLTVQNGVLSATVNGKSAGSWAASIPSDPTIVGVMVEENSHPSQTVRFSNFAFFGRSATN